MIERPWPAEEHIPTDITGAYSCLSCLQSDVSHSAYLCRNREDGSLCLLKTAHTAERVRQLVTDHEMLCLLAGQAETHTLFPTPIALHHELEDGCQLRSWIAGQSLDQYVESAYAGTGLPKGEALAIAEALLSQLSLLHRLEPPVIHRDIKPQNVILDADGQPHLIDFGIARQWKSGRHFDTQINGTEALAAPEQFGYSQTDERSDLYAMGLLLRFLLTEDYEEAADSRIPHRVAAVIRKATRFDPQRRYQSAEQMRRAIHRLRHPALRIGLTALICVLLLLSAGVYMRGNSAYSFYEPLIEQAIRIQLDKPDGAISRRELRQITSLHIFGRQFYEDDSQFWFLGDYTFPLQSGIAAENKWQENGNIHRLDDLLAMPNCRVVSLYRQQIGDLSLIPRTNVEALGIGWNPVSDLSPLAGDTRLTALNLSCLGLTDFTPLASLSRLSTLCLSGVGDFPCAPLIGLPLEELNLADAFNDEDAWLAELPLQKLTLSKLHPGIVYTLRRMGQLRSLEVTHTEEVRLRELEAVPSLTALNYDTGGEQEPLTDQPLLLPKLRELTLKNVRLPSLRVLSELTELEELGIYACEVDDYHGLEGLTQLKTIYATDEQWEQLEALYPGNGWGRD